MERRGIAIGVLTLLGAGAFGWLCLHTDETGILACSLMLLTSLLAFARPRQAWLAALLPGLAAPGAQALAHLFAWHIPYPNGPVPTSGDWSDVAGACVALIFATVGAGAGALAGWALGRARGGIARTWE